MTPKSYKPLCKISLLCEHSLLCTIAAAFYNPASLQEFQDEILDLSGHHLKGKKVCCVINNNSSGLLSNISTKKRTTHDNFSKCL